MVDSKNDSVRDSLHACTGCRCGVSEAVGEVKLLSLLVHSFCICNRRMLLICTAYLYFLKVKHTQLHFLNHSRLLLRSLRILCRSSIQNFA